MNLSWNSYLGIITYLFSISSARSNTVGAEFVLMDGDTDGEGIITVRRNNQKSYICAHKWDIRNSRVLCTQLGYSMFHSVGVRALNSVADNLNYWRTVYYCQGRESSLLECKDDYLYQYDIEEKCMAPNVVWISCKGKLNGNISQTMMRKELKDFSLRLNNRKLDGQIINQGILEAKVGKTWRKICGDGWSQQESLVACGQLGFPNVNKTEVRNASNIFFRYSPMRFRCSGTEVSLLSCLKEESHNRCGKGSVKLSCSKVRDDFGEIIGGKTAETGLVRLRAGHRESEGRVEIFVDGAWSTVCDQEWDAQPANVICRQLGFGTAKVVTKESRFGEGVGKIRIASVNCSGHENSIFDCNIKRSINQCEHRNDAGVICNYPRVRFQKIRLQGGPTSREGRVEVFSQGQWYGVCGIGFDIRDGRVVCRELGLGFAKEAYEGYEFGVRYEKLMFDVNCKGDEKTLTDCSHLTRRRGRCTYYSMAIVKCTEVFPDIVVDLDALTSSIRLTKAKMYSLTCAREEKCLSSSAYQDLTFYSPKYQRNLLRFSARILNKGTAAFLPIKRRSSWIWHACHKHFHSMERFSDFDIIDKYGTKVAEGHKASFCLEDTNCEDGYQKVFNCTNKGQQGISVNCADNYKYTIDCQWVDLTDIPYGNYTLLIHINPENSIGESDYANNYAACEIHYTDGKINVGHCSADPCHVRSFGGTGHGMCCHFPFIFNGNSYYECTADGNGHQWCSTTANYDKDQKWGYCERERALAEKTEDSNSVVRT